LTARGLFISKAIAGMRYIAERFYKGRDNLLWSVITAALNQPDAPIDAQMVPERIRRQAYRYLRDSGR
jgi:hypothetical protein